MKRFNNDQEIIDKLKKLPKVVDRTDKDELYRRIALKSNTRQSKPKKMNKLIPVFSIATVAIIILIMLPTIFNQGTFITSEKSSDNASEADYGKSDQGMEESSVENEMDIESRILTDEAGSFVVQEIDTDLLIIHGALADNQVQYVIPVSVIVSNTEDLSYHYSNLGAYLDEAEWGLNDYLFKNISFDVNVPENEVIMHLPDNFSVGEGSSLPYLFSETLSAMFSPYNIEKIIFNSDNHDGAVDLGPLGTLKEMPLNEQVTSNYKKFQTSERNRAFLIPIKQEDKSIEVAINEMKNSEEDFDVYQTIPDDVNFTINSGKSELIITFTDNTDLKDQQDYVTMIEAMLMTAKSYGYDSVKFENTLTEYIGPYNLNESIQTPLAVNPIYIFE